MKRTWADKQTLFPEFNDGCFIRDDMTKEREKEWIDFCFDAYESDGFMKTYGTPYDGERKYVGMKFEVIGRVPNIEDDFENGTDLECQPMWFIRLENGEEMAAYPEEICLSETQEYKKKNTKYFTSK